MPKIDSLLSQLNNQPYKVQLAVSADWEHAWKLNPSYRYTVEEIDKFLDRDDSHTVAIEVFYRTAENQDLYFGIRYSPELKSVKSPKEFVDKVLALELKENLSFNQLIRELGIELNNGEETFRLSRPQRIMLGVVDYWLKYGPYEIWNSNKAIAVTLKSLETNLGNHPNLVKNTDNYTGLEFVYKGAATYWLSFQVSNLENGQFKLDFPKVVGYTSDILSE